MQVDIVTSALPTGAATSAKQDTIIGHVDGMEGLLTTIDEDTANISTKIDTIAGDTGPRMGFSFAIKNAASTSVKDIIGGFIPFAR